MPEQVAHMLHMLPGALQAVIQRLPEAVRSQLEEIRVREGRPLEIASGGKSRFVRADGTLVQAPQDAFCPDALLCRQLLERITNHSLYAMEEELKRGFITVAGGHRIGLAGRTVLEGSQVRGLRDVAGFNIRLARERIGACAPLLPRLLDMRQQTVGSTLLIGPPQQGKTTLARDLARAISSGDWGHPAAKGWPGRKVGLVDERSELAGSLRGVPTFNVGPRTDVMDACPKAEGMMMMIRSMSPEVLVVDEVGGAADAAALQEAGHAGVTIIATAHAVDLDDARARPGLKLLLDAAVFDYAVVVRRNDSGLCFSVHALLPRVRAPSTFQWRDGSGGNWGPDRGGDWGGGRDG